MTQKKKSENVQLPEQNSQIDKSQEEQASKIQVFNSKISKSYRYQKLTQRKPWIKEEDELIIAYVQRHGKGKWSHISKYLSNRSGKQIRERFLQILDPNIERKKFTIEDDYRIIQLVEQFGSKWKLISSFLQNRSDNQIKNRFYTHIKKKILMLDPDKYEHILQKIQQEQQGEKESISPSKVPIIQQPATSQPNIEIKIEPSQNNQNAQQPIEQIQIKQEPGLEHQNEEVQQTPEVAYQNPAYKFRPPKLMIQRGNAQLQPQQQEYSSNISITATMDSTFGQQSPQLLKAIQLITHLQNQMIQKNQQFYQYLNFYQTMFPSFDFQELFSLNNYQLQQSQQMPNQFVQQSPRLSINYNNYQLVYQNITNNSNIMDFHTENQQ